MFSNTSAPNNEIQSHYTGRAVNYDERDGGGHIQLGKDIVGWLAPIEPGSVALNLACGTGLVTISLASAIGPSGRVVGVDLTKAMLDQARSKPVLTDSAPIEWIEDDIMALPAVPAVQSVVRERGGFDIISCCSAFVLLPSPSAAIKSWSELLKPGGKMIIDVPTEDKTLQYFIGVEMREVLDLPHELHRSWVKDANSLWNVFEEAGLTVEQSYRTRNYAEALKTEMYDGSEAQEIWKEHLQKLRNFVHSH